MELDARYINCWDTFNMLIDLNKGREELKQWINLNISNFRENEHRPIMSKPEQVFTDIVVDKITSNFLREADDVQTLIGMCMHAKELIERALPLLEIQGVSPRYLYWLLCFHLCSQMFSETEYEFKSYIDPYFIETRVMWSMAFQAMHEHQ